MEASHGTSLLGAPARFAPGLTALGDGLHAWLQPNGGLGESNAGLVVGDGGSLLVDTLWDLRLTRLMLDAMAPLTASAPIHTLVNTHADGDHCWGNQLLGDAEIVATRAGAEDMLEEDPSGLRRLRDAMRVVGPVARLAAPLPGGRSVAGLAAFGRQLAPYDFSGIDLTPPTRTFDGRLALDAGGRRVELVEVGPAHTPGDLIVHVPDADVVFAGDILFSGVTPIMWVGPVENWIAALDRIEALEPRTVVPGHGPVSGLDEVRALRAYWEWLATAVRERVAAGADPVDAARDIARSDAFRAQPFASWDGVERIVVNAATIARSDRGGTGRVGARERTALVTAMGGLALELSRERAAS